MKVLQLMTYNPIELSLYDETRGGGRTSLLMPNTWAMTY